MWSNFADFALKAQKDLQDQANEAASKLQQQLPPISVRASRVMHQYYIRIYFYIYLNVTSIIFQLNMCMSIIIYGLRYLLYLL